jgi:hypothetical protein
LAVWADAADAGPPADVAGDAAGVVFDELVFGELAFVVLADVGLAVAVFFAGLRGERDDSGIRPVCSFARRPHYATLRGSGAAVIVPLSDHQPLCETA